MCNRKERLLVIKTELELLGTESQKIKGARFSFIMELVILILYDIITLLAEDKCCKSKE